MKGAIISTDPEFRRRLVEAFASDAGLEFGLEVDEPFTAITDSQLKKLRDLESDVVFVDLESDPQVGLKFAQFLVDSSLAQAVVGAGSTQQPELLLQAMQAGILEFLPKSLESEKVRGLVERLRKRTGKVSTTKESRELGKLLSVFSPKGGSGATAFAVNLAVSIHQVSRKRTLIVDLDLELGETALLLGMEPRFSSVDLVRNYHRVDEGLLASYIEKDSSGVELLSAPYQPADFQTVDGDRIGSILRFLKEHFDYVIVDALKTLNPSDLERLRGIGSDPPAEYCRPPIPQKCDAVASALARTCGQPSRRLDPSCREPLQPFSRHHGGRGGAHAGDEGLLDSQERLSGSDRLDQRRPPGGSGEEVSLCTERSGHGRRYHGCGSEAEAEIQNSGEVPRGSPEVSNRPI